MRHVLGTKWTVAAVLIALLPLAACSGKNKDEGATTTDTTSAAQSPTVAGEGKAHIVGVIERMTGADVSFDSVAPPFTFNVAEVGRGGLELPNVNIDGQPSSIVWSGGRPLPVTGDCRLDARNINIAIDTNGLHLTLDGAVRQFTEGTCHFGSSVAVGQGGLSDPQDSVDFTVGDKANFKTTGGVTVILNPINRYEGRKGLLALTGRLRVTTESSTFEVPSLVLNTGTWVASVAIHDGELLVTADVEGDLVVSKD